MCILSKVNNLMSGNYTHEEDIFLCRAWLDTTGDPIKGKDQTSNTFLNRINIALVTYNKERNETFKFQHCWVELRNSLEWNLEGIAGGVRKRNVVMYPQTSSTLEHFNLDDYDDSPSLVTQSLERPEGQKLAKQNLPKQKGKDIDTRSSEVKGLIIENHELVRGMHFEKLDAVKLQESIDEMMRMKRE